MVFLIKKIVVVFLLVFFIISALLYLVNIYFQKTDDAFIEKNNDIPKQIIEVKTETEIQLERTKELTSFSDHNTSNGWEILLNEEFKGEELNDSYWTALYDDFGWSGRKQIYLPENVEVKNDLLTINLLKEKNGDFDYSSGAIVTKDKLNFKYGKIEVKAKFPKGKGFLPAIWMLTTSGEEFPEIDIAEIIGQRPGELWNVVHSLDSNKKHVREYKMTDVGDTTDGFHTYGIEWDEEKIVYFFDGKKIFTGTDLIPNEDMYLYINTGIGGSWVGDPNETTIFPNTMLIDYIRYYK